MNAEILPALPHGLTKTIDIDEALRLITLVVVGNESFVYRDNDAPDLGDGGYCVYVRRTEASCVVGKALALAGVPVGVLSLLDNGDYSTSAGSLRRHLPITAGADRVFEAAQVKQDCMNVTWGEALSAAVMAYFHEKNRP